MGMIDSSMLCSCQTCRGLGSQMICCKLCTAQGKIYKFTCVYDRYHMHVNCMYQLVVNRMRLVLLVTNFKSHALFSQTFQPLEVFSGCSKSFKTMSICVILF